MVLPPWNAGRLRAVLVIATIVWAGSRGNRSGAEEPAAMAAPANPVIWTLGTMASIGGHVPIVLGTPRVAEDGRAVWFNGVDAGLILAVNPLAGLKEFTLEILLKPEAGGGAEQRFFHAEDDAASRVLLEIRLTPEGRWVLDSFMLSGGRGLTLLDRSKLHPADQWHWVALRYDGHRMAHYVNGQMELEGPLDFAPMTSGRTSLGVRLNQVFWFKGAMREVRLHAAALDAAALQRVP
jgi:hypothetical protein